MAKAALLTTHDNYSGPNNNYCNNINDHYGYNKLIMPANNKPLASCLTVTTNMKKDKQCFQYYRPELKSPIYLYLPVNDHFHIIQKKMDDHICLMNGDALVSPAKHSFSVCVCR